MRSSKSSFPPAWRILCLTAGVLLTQAACTTYDAPVMSESEYAAAKAAMLARPRKIMHNNDGCDVTSFKKKDLPVTVQKFLDLRTSYTAGIVDTIIYCPISSGFGQFTVELPGCDWLTTDPPGRNYRMIPENERVYINIAEELKELGTDALQEVIKFGHAHNQEVFFGFRVNDTHDCHYRPENDCKFFNEWKRARRHYLFCEDHTQNMVHGSWSCVDFAHPEVRRKQIDMVQAVVDKYDIDGIEFDFSRYLPKFKRVAAGDEANQTERDQLTGMFREIRRVVDRKGRERGRPILISMQLPDSVGYCRANGIDLEVWLEEGLLDIMALPDSFRLNTYADGAALAHKYGRLYYAQLGYPWPFEREERGTSMSRLQAPSYYARALAALESGADGLLYANITEPGGVRNLMKSDVEWLKKQDKRYFITDIGWDNIEGALASGERYNNLPQIMWRPRPRFITPGVAQEFILEIGDDLEALAAAGKYPEVTALVDLASGHMGGKLSIASNGLEWPRVATGERYESFAVPAGALKKGANKLTLSVKPAADGDTALECDLPLFKENKTEPIADSRWRKLFKSHNPEAFTQLPEGWRIADTGLAEDDMANVLYPFFFRAGATVFDFEAQLIDSDDERAVVARVADGAHVEIVSLLPGKVKLLYSGFEMPLDTKKFHRYRVLFYADRMVFSVDGEELFTTDKLTRSDIIETVLKGHKDRYFCQNVSSMLMGSLSGKGSGTAVWRDVTVGSLPGSVELRNFAVEVKFQDNAASSPLRKAKKD